MAYQWHYNDNDLQITEGSDDANVINFVGMVNDDFGRLYKFNITHEEISTNHVYHIHFNGYIGFKVRCIRIKTSHHDPLGHNICENNNQDELKTLRELSYDCGHAGFPNHAKLLDKLRNAIPRI